VYIASPEKALLDLVHLTRGPIRRRFLEELRLAAGQLDPETLQRLARRTLKPKLIHAALLAARLLAAGSRKKEAR
jgi:hypothetical protein